MSSSEISQDGGKQVLACYLRILVFYHMAPSMSSGVKDDLVILCAEMCGKNVALGTLQFGSNCIGLLNSLTLCSGIHLIE